MRYITPVGDFFRKNILSKRSPCTIGTNHAWLMKQNYWSFLRITVLIFHGAIFTFWTSFFNKINNFHFITLLYNYTTWLLVTLLVICSCRSCIIEEWIIVVAFMVRSCCFLRFFVVVLLLHLVQVPNELYMYLTGTAWNSHRDYFRSTTCDGEIPS